jgi:hypothetical protein
VEFLAPYVRALTPGLSQAAVRALIEQFEQRPGRAVSHGG